MSLNTPNIAIDRRLVRTKEFHGNSFLYLTTPARQDLGVRPGDRPVIVFETDERTGRRIIWWWTGLEWEQITGIWRLFQTTVPALSETAVDVLPSGIVSADYIFTLTDGIASKHFHFDVALDDGIWKTTAYGVLGRMKAGIRIDGQEILVDNRESSTASVEFARLIM